MVFVQNEVVKHNYSHSAMNCSATYTGIQTDLIILDFSNAFDKVPHKKLLWKLNNYVIRGNTWKWVSAFLSNRMQQIALGGEVQHAQRVLARNHLGRCFFAVKCR